MASGTIIGSTGNQYIDAKIVWSSEVITGTLQSTVTAALYYKRNNTGYTTYGTGTFKINIGGNIASATKTLTITENAWVKAIEHTVTVTHDSDGTKTVSVTVSGSIPDTSLSSTTVFGYLTLDTIARETTIESVVGRTKAFNTGVRFTYLPKTASVYSRCNIAVNLDGEYIAVRSINLGKKSATTQTEDVTFTEDELSIIYNLFPNSREGTLRFTMRTYSDSGYSKQIGDGNYKEITLYIYSSSLADTLPTATMTLSPVSSLPSPFDALYIKGRSKIDANFTDGEGKYGASIVSYKMSVLGKTYGSPYTSEYITTDGDVEVTGTVTDSRGFPRTYTQTVTFLPYANPRIIPASGDSAIVCERCDASGNLSESGTYLRIKAKRNYSKVVSSGVQKNFCSIRYRYKPDGGSYSAWTTILAAIAASDEVDTGALLGGALLSTRSYVVQVGVVDSLGETDYTSVHIPTDKIYMHKAGSMNSLGIGKYVEEENTVDIAEDITTKFRGKVIFAGEAWLNLGLSENVAESESNFGRWGGTGCYYRVCAGEKHVYVAFNCAFTYEGSAIQINLESIPKEYRPSRNVYAICATGGRAVARILVNKDGNIFVDWLQIISSAEQTTSSTVKWIDGYIDYWT